MPSPIRSAVIGALCLPALLVGWLFAAAVRLMWGKSLAFRGPVLTVTLSETSWPMRTWWKHWFGFSMGYGVMLNPNATESTVKHELEHTFQAQAGSIAAIPAAVLLGVFCHWTVGLLFLLLAPLLNYAGGALVAWIGGGNAYWDNLFERAARDSVEVNSKLNEWSKKVG